MKVLTVPSSGSVAGTTASRNRFGQYVRTRAIPTNPNSARQTVTRSTLAATSGSWQLLSFAEQTAWNEYAASHPRIDSLGQTIVLSGAQMYASINCMMINAGYAAVVDAPSGETIDPPILGAVAIATDAATVAFTPTPVEAGRKILIYCSPPASFGVTFFRDLRFLQAVPSAGTSPANVLAAMTAKYGTILTGQRYAFRLYQISSGGQVSTWSNQVTDSVDA